MKCIYVAGALNADAVGYLKNVHRMIVAADAIRKVGYSVFVPCLDMLCGIVAGNYEYTDYAGNNMFWMEKADAIFVLPNSEHSKGTQAEIARAKELNIPVVHSLVELLDVGIRPEHSTPRP